MMASRPDDVIFEHELDMKYICPICLTVFWNPIQTACGHRFCKQCIAGVIRETKLTSRSGIRWTYCKCPVDKKFFCTKDDIFEDKAFQREVLSLKVKCTNHNMGCSWVDDFRELKNHMTHCLYYQENCCNGCGERLLRRDIDTHLQVCEQRAVQCEHCTEEIIYADLTKHQVLMCANFPVQCTLCGQTGIRRKDISSHIDVNTGDCPHTIIPCRYASYGCQYQGKRRGITDHYKTDTDQHILLLVQHNSSQDRTIRNLSEKLDQFKELLTIVVGSKETDQIKKI